MAELRPLFCARGSGDFARKVAKLLALSAEEVQAIRAIGENAGCMALKGASLEHEGDPRADRWSVDDELAAVAGRWSVDPARDLLKRELSTVND